MYNWWFIIGKVKMAFALRVLGGSSPFNMTLVFDTFFSTLCKIIKYVMENWLSHELFCPIDGIEYCSNDARMASVALKFFETSSGLMNGCIGALDGWIVKIQKQTKSDRVNNPQSFYSHKGYYGVNIQVIVDKNKRNMF
jgi:hypothetical protein